MSTFKNSIKMLIKFVLMKLAIDFENEFYKLATF